MDEASVLLADDAEERRDAFDFQCREDGVICLPIGTKRRSRLRLLGQESSGNLLDETVDDGSSVRW